FGPTGLPARAGDGWHPSPALLTHTNTPANEYHLRKTGSARGDQHTSRNRRNQGKTPCRIIPVAGHARGVSSLHAHGWHGLRAQRAAASQHTSSYMFHLGDARRRCSSGAV